MASLVSTIRESMTDYPDFEVEVEVEVETAKGTEVDIRLNLAAVYYRDERIWSHDGGKTLAEAIEGIK